ncbi:MAG: single-stranded DNA-binding protein [Butyrivibrio sp.]|nr:single-stranded DNA-binding protein [Butyrivibrio sp.]MBP3279699.1 single-stranded DNA-binding protein [Butyrivibrio sp.]
MNRCIFTGRLAKDPEVRYSQGEKPTAIARFSLAIDKQDKEHNTGFINVVAFGRLGEFSEKYLKKGMKIELESHVVPGSYEKDGKKVYTFDFQADKIDFAESKKESQGNVGNSAPAPSGVDEDDGFMDIPDGIEENLPFN